MAVTPIRNMRVDDERWAAWEASAAAAGVSITKLVVMTMDNAGHSRSGAKPPEPVPQAWPAGGGTSFVFPASVGMGLDVLASPPAVVVPPREPERRPERKRSKVCPHRIPETSYCRYCDGG